MSTIAKLAISASVVLGISACHEQPREKEKHEQPREKEKRLLHSHIENVEIGKEFGVSLRELGIPFPRGLQRCTFDNEIDYGAIGGIERHYIVTPTEGTFFTPEVIHALDSICESDPEVWGKGKASYYLSFRFDQQFKDSLHYVKYQVASPMGINYEIYKDSIKIYYAGGD